MSSRPNDEDPRVQRTRQLLQQALVDLLSVKDFQKITVSDVAAQAGVNRATFYAHFEDKQALADYAVQTSFQLMLDRDLPPDATLSPENLHHLILVVCEFLGGFVDHCAPSGVHQRVALLEIRVQDCVQAVLLKWIRESPLSPSPSSPEIIARAVSWPIFGAVYEWAYDRRRPPAAHLAAQLLPVLLDGMTGIISEAAAAG